LANWYLTMCKLNGGNHRCSKTDVARRYLVAKINKALFERTKKSEVQSK